MIIARGLPLHARQRQRGFTLMETVLVIAVGLGLVIGGIMFYQAAFAKAEAAHVARMISGLAADVRLLHAKGGSVLSGTLDGDHGLDVTASVKSLYAGSPEVFNYVEVVSIHHPVRMGPIVGYIDHAGPIAFTVRLWQRVTNSKLCQRLAAIDTGAVYARADSCEGGRPGYPRFLLAFSP